MKIAIISDIHGNNVALEAVLNQAKILQVEYLLVLGDLVGYYYYPDIVLDLLASWPKEMVGGNHEKMLAAVLKQPDLRSNIHQKYGSGLEYALNKLSLVDIQMLTSLPENKTIHIDGLKIDLCHGSPWDNNYYVYPDADISVLERCAAVDSDFLFMGHTHYPFIFSANATVVVNVGSVGQARNKGGIASWVILNTLNRSISVKQTYYDVSALVNETKVIDPHISYLWEVLLRGCCRLP